jgi:hypothetical protein
MKRYIAVLLLVLSGILGSCKKFLAEKQVSNLTQNYYNTEDGLNALVNGLYVYARIKHEWDASGARITQAETDAYMAATNTWATMTSQIYGSNIATVTGNVNNYIGADNTTTFAPMGAYPHINNCNIALDIIDNIMPGKFASDETYRKTRRGEILFLRSWAYYLISNQLGDVPLLLTPRREDNGVYYYPKAKLEDVYKQIIADMREAYATLPVSVTDRGRAGKLAAGHFLAKLYLNRAQATAFQNSSEPHLKMLYKGNVATDLDSAIIIATEVINAAGGVSGLAPDYWTLFDPKVSETTPHKEVLWSAQFEVNTSLHARFGNRSCNYHTGNYTDATGVTRVQAYGRPFGTFKPTDFGYDVFTDKVNDSRYYKTFQYEYICNTTGSFTWNANAAAWWNANKPAGEPAVSVSAPRATIGKRALIYIENQQSEALDSTMVMSQPYQFIVRWVRSAATGRYYYRLNHTQKSIGLNTGTPAPYLSVKKYIDPLRGGSADEANYNSEAGTRDAILMRLAETYLTRAEAYGRKGQYAQAVADINVLRNRAAYKNGENRPNVLVEWEPKATTLAASERITPFAANGSSYNTIKVTEDYFTPGTPQALAENYIPTVTSKENMFVHFIYNEKTREMLAEGTLWEDLHNAGILYDRVMYLNQMASNLAGRWPVAYNIENGNGQNGNGKGQMDKKFTFRPWPSEYLMLLTDENGKPLDDNAIKAYQNFGY